MECKKKLYLHISKEKNHIPPLEMATIRGKHKCQELELEGIYLYSGTFVVCRVSFNSFLGSH